VYQVGKEIKRMYYRNPCSDHDPLTH